MNKKQPPPPAETPQTPGFRSLCQVIEAQWADLPKLASPVLLAVSGGSDSVALARGVAAAIGDSQRPQIVIAHFNHRWRGDTASDDAEWVSRLATSLGADAVMGSAKVAGPCSEATARTERYRFLVESARRYGARYVATGHTADDQAETVLMRVLRGTGLAGLAGIARLRQLSADITAIRPLLTVTRQMLQTALREVGQSWLDDATNDDRRYTRNWIRHDLLPRLRQRLPHDVDTSLQQLAQQATGWHSWHSELAESLVRQLVDIRWQGERRLVQIDVAGLVNTRLLGSPLPDMLVAELFRHVWRQQGWPEQSMGERQWQQLVAACHSERGLRLELPGGVGARRETHHLVLAR